MEIVFGLLSALSFGVADFLARFSTRRIGVYRTLLYMQVVGLLILSVFLLASGAFMHLPPASWQSWLWGLVCALIYSAGYICLYRAFSIGQLAVVAPIASSYAAVTVILSVISGEKLRIVQIIGIVAVLVGVVLAALHKTEESHEAEREAERSGENRRAAGERSRPVAGQQGAAAIPVQVSEREQAEPQRAGKSPGALIAALPAGVPWAILAALGLGLTFWLLGFAVAPALGDTLPIWLFRLVGVIVLIPLSLGARQDIALPQGVPLALVIGIGLLDMGAFIFSTLGFATGQVAIVSVLTSLYSAVAVILAWIFLKERLRPIQWAGIVLLLLGIALTHL